MNPAINKNGKTTITGIRCASQKNRLIMNMLQLLTASACSIGFFSASMSVIMKKNTIIAPVNSMPLVASFVYAAIPCRLVMFVSPVVLIVIVPLRFCYGTPYTKSYYNGYYQCD